MKNQTFGIEMETIGHDREGVAYILARHFGTHPIYIGRTYDKWEVRLPDGRIWSVVSDSSLRDANGEMKNTAEVVSPICKWEDLQMVCKVAEVLKSNGCSVNPTCGVHVHIGAGYHTPESLRTLTNLVNAKDTLLELVLGNTSRRDRYCRPNFPEYINQLNRQKPQTFGEFAEIYYKYNSEPYELSNYRAEQEQTFHYADSRYHTLNLHSFFTTSRKSHTIEFRCFNGTVEPDEVKADILLALAISAKALTTKYASPTPYAGATTISQIENPRYAFRCWLLSLGFIGKEYASTRHVFCHKLDGDSAFHDPVGRW